MKGFRPVRSLRMRYVLGFSAIALLVTASFMTMQHVISEQRDFSILINLAGHQSGLASRIAYFAGLMATTEDEDEFNMARAQVGRTIHKMEQAHDKLRHGDPEEGVPRVTNDNLELIYDDPMVGLDLALKRFLERARGIYGSDMASLTTGSPHYIFLTTYGPHVLEPMFDAAVEEYGRIGREAILRIEKLETGLWITSLIILLLEVLLIFRPLEGRIRQSITSLEHTVSELEATRERLLAAQRLADMGDWHWEVAGSALVWSDQVYRICGVPAASFRPTTEAALELVHPGDRAAVRRALERIRTEGEETSFEHRLLRPDGSERMVVQHAVARRDTEGRVSSVAGTIQDVTERRELSARLEKISRNIPGFIYQYQLDADGSSRFPYASRGIDEVYGLTPERVREDAGPVFAMLHEDDLERVTEAVMASARQLSTWNDQYRVQHPVKGEIWVEGHATPERLADGATLWHGYLRDVTDRKQSEDRIRELALFDPLTGLANRRLLKDRLEHALAAARRSHEYGAVMMLDLDNFKTLNDTQGHGAGDALLVEVGRRLMDNVREIDTIARLGGDEFVGIFEGFGRCETEARTRIGDVAEKVRAALQEPFDADGSGHAYHITSSIGIALFHGASAGVEELLKQADVALFEAKDSGRNCVCFFSEERQAIINSRTTLVNALRQALDGGELSLYYQPQFAANGRLVGAEALVRWLPPGREPVSPGAFIPVAEDTGLILPMGKWIFETVCAQLDELEALGLPEDFAIAVNISPRQFSDPRFLHDILDTVAASGVATGRLKLELTEGSLFQDLERAKAILDELRATGLNIELDDFGTGYSSLTSLQQLPLDTLKLDGTLVRDIGTTDSGAAIVRAAIAMAKALSMSVVAEGVETPSQRDFLTAEGCDILQGFLLARPMPFASLAERVTAVGRPAEPLADDVCLATVRA